MSLPVFPSAVRGLTWSVMKTPQFDAIVQSSPSAVEERFPQRTNPVWTWTLIYDYLKDAPLDLVASLAPHTDYRTMCGFFLARRGRGDDFLYLDPDDNTVGPAIHLDGSPNLDAELQVVTDGVNYYSPLQRNFGGQFMEDISDYNASAPFLIYANAVPTTAWTLKGPGLAVAGQSFRGLYLQWSSAPATPVTASFQFTFRVRFSTDEQDFEKVMDQLWAIGGSRGRNGSGTLKFQSSLAPLYGSIAGGGGGSPPSPTTPPATMSFTVPSGAPVYLMQFGVNLGNWVQDVHPSAWSTSTDITLPGGWQMQISGPKTGGGTQEKTITVQAAGVGRPGSWTLPSPWATNALYPDNPTLGGSSDPVPNTVVAFVSQDDGFAFTAGDVITVSYIGGLFSPAGKHSSPTDLTVQTAFQDVFYPTGPSGYDTGITAGYDPATCTGYGNYWAGYGCNPSPTNPILMFALLGCFAGHWSGSSPAPGDRHFWGGNIVGEPFAVNFGNAYSVP